MKIHVVAAAAAAILFAPVGTANAAVVMFAGDPATTFADGTFSHHLSGIHADGFSSTSPFSAFNNFGQNAESIYFTKPVTLNSLAIGKCGGCYDSHPATFTVSLYDAASLLIDAQSVTASSTEATLNFDLPNVSKVEFTFAGEDGSNPYGDGRSVAWFHVRDIVYSVASVPEPGAWALMIAGFGLAGAGLRRRRVSLNS